MHMRLVALKFLHAWCVPTTVFASPSSVDSGSLSDQAQVERVDVGQQAPAWQHDGLTWRHVT